MELSESVIEMKQASPIGVMYYDNLRYFGKTLNMSMLANFFNITKDSLELFKDTKITNTKFASELNQWPTVFISFAFIKYGK